MTTIWTSLLNNCIFHAQVRQERESAIWVHAAGWSSTRLSQGTSTLLFGWNLTYEEKLHYKLISPDGLLLHRCGSDGL